MVKVWLVAAGSTVPVIAPAEVFKLSPVGRVPAETDHEPKGGVPPETERVWLYVPVRVAEGNEFGEMLGETLTVMVSDFAAVTPLMSVRVTVKVWLVAATPSVPVIAPDAALRPSPEGSEPVVTDQV